MSLNLRLAVSLPFVVVVACVAWSAETGPMAAVVGVCFVLLWLEVVLTGLIPRITDKIVPQCRKCGTSTEVNLDYVASTDTIEINCLRCGYEWTMSPFDIVNQPKQSR